MEYSPPLEGQIALKIKWNLRDEDKKGIKFVIGPKKKNDRKICFSSSYSKFREERGRHTLISYSAGKEGPIRLWTALSLVLSAMWDTVLFFFLIACGCGIPSFHLSP